MRCSASPRRVRVGEAAVIRSERRQRGGVCLLGILLGGRGRRHGLLPARTEPRHELLGVVAAAVVVVVVGPPLRFLSRWKCEKLRPMPPPGFSWSTLAAREGTGLLVVFLLAPSMLSASLVWAKGVVGRLS